MQLVTLFTGFNLYLRYILNIFLSFSWIYVTRFDKSVTCRKYLLAFDVILRVTLIALNSSSCGGFSRLQYLDLPCMFA